jgi:hypothetical protein
LLICERQTVSEWRFVELIEPDS